MNTHLFTVPLDTYGTYLVDVFSSCFLLGTCIYASIFLFHPWWIEDVDLQSVTQKIRSDEAEERQKRWDISDEIISLVAYVNPQIDVALRYSFHLPKIEQVGMICNASDHFRATSWDQRTGESAIRFHINSCKGSCHNNSDDIVILVGDHPVSKFHSNVGNCLLGEVKQANYFEATRMRFSVNHSSNCSLSKDGSLLSKQLSTKLDIFPTVTAAVAISAYPGYSETTRRERRSASCASNSGEKVTFHFRRVNFFYYDKWGSKLHHRTLLKYELLNVDYKMELGDTFIDFMITLDPFMSQVDVRARSWRTLLSEMAGLFGFVNIVLFSFRFYNIWRLNSNPIVADFENPAKSDGLNDESDLYFSIAGGVVSIHTIDD